MQVTKLFQTGEINPKMEEWLLKFKDAVDALNHIEELFANMQGQEILGEIDEFVSITGPVYIGKGAKIHSNVTIEGPAYIGENVDVRSHTLIRNHAYLADDCVVGHGADIKRSICLNGAKIQINTFTGDSVLGAAARIGSGAVLSNRKFNQTEVYYKNENRENTPSNRGHMGCVIGRHSRIGANCVVSPGTMIGEHTWIGSGCVIGGKYDDNMFVTVKQELEVRPKDIVELESGKGEWEPA